MPKLNFGASFAAPQIQARIGTSITFVWAGCLLLSFIFAFVCIPETKGLSIEEIDSMYLSGYPAWRSSDFKRSQEEAAIKSHEKHYARSAHREAVDGESFGTKGKASQMTSARTSAETQHEPSAV